MAYKTILVHLDSSRRCAQRVGLAALWARVHGGRLVGLVPTGVFDGSIPAEALRRGAPDFISASEDFLRSRAERISREFREQLGDSVPHEVRLVDAPAVDALVRHARTSDLVVLGQHDVDDPECDSASGDLPPRVLMEAGVPLLVVPFAGHFAQIPRAAVLAWDGSREASAVIRSAVPALQLIRSVTVLSFGLPDETAGDALLMPQLLQLLRSHGVQANARREVTDIDTGDALLSRLTDLGADLLVMGGYGHSRFRELVLGGATRRILGSMTVPVFMAH